MNRLLFPIMAVLLLVPALVLLAACEAVPPTITPEQTAPRSNPQSAATPTLASAGTPVPTHAAEPTWTPQLAPTHTPEPTWTPEPTLTPEPTPTHTPEPGFGDGTWRVGDDVASGLYAAPGGDFCYWARLSGFGGTLDEIIANDLGPGRKLAAIVSTDVGFDTSGCGRWKPHETVASPLTTIPDGIWMVGPEILPGTYSAPGGDFCYWARLSGFTGSLDEVIANDLGAGRKIVTIQQGDAGFDTRGCGAWNPS